MKNEDITYRYTAEEKLWHTGIGHTFTLPTVRNQLNKGFLPHAECRKTDCERYAKGKYRRRFKGSLTTATTVFRLHCDTKGKVKCVSDDGHKYFLTIIDEHSRLVYAYPIRSISEASAMLLRYVKRFEKQSGHTIKSVHTDNGTECLRAFDTLSADGVHVSTSTVDTLESNGLAERTHQTIMNDVRTCLVQANIPERFLHFELRHAVNCRNVVPHTSTGEITYLIVYVVMPSYIKHIRPFGCRVKYRPKAEKLTTFGPRTQDGLNLLHEDGGIFKILTDEGVVRTKPVTFRESEFPGLSVIGSGRNESRVDNGNDGALLVPIPTSPHVITDLNLLTESTNQNLQPTASDSWTSSEVREMLTHYPASPDSPNTTQNETTKDGGDDNVNNNAENNQQQQEAPKYNLRPNRFQQQYSAAAIPNGITTSDEPTLKEALESLQRNYWLQRL